MSKNRRDLTAEEHKLWRRVAATVKLRRALHPDEKSERIAPRSLKLAAAKPLPNSRHAGPAPPPPNRAGEKRVRRGSIEIGAKLDLHGHTQDSAKAALVGFLHRAQERGDRAVIVVTGAGRGGEGVLKRAFPQWLAEKGVRSVVSGYAPAHRSHGGAGAFYVFIKRRRD